MMLDELCKRIDWSNIDHSHESWRKLHPADFEPDPEFLFRWRCVLLESAISDSDVKRRLQAISALNSMGVWSQVLKILEAQGLLAEGFNATSYKTGTYTPLTTT